MVLNVLTPSRASSLPQVFRHGWGFVVWQHRLVFEVAGDLSGIIYLLWERACSRKRCVRRDGVERADAFASKLAPTGFSAWLGICGVATQAGFGGCRGSGGNHLSTVGASLLAKAVCQAMIVLNVPTPSRASSLPQFFWHDWGFVAWQHKLVFEVAGDLGGIIFLMWERACTRKRCVRRDGVECADAFASKLAPTGFSAWLGICGVAAQSGLRLPTIWGDHLSTVGASLLAKAVCQARWC